MSRQRAQQQWVFKVNFKRDHVLIKGGFDNLWLVTNTLSKITIIFRGIFRQLVKVTSHTTANLPQVPMLGQVGKYSEIINNGLRKYNLCAETFILCAEIFIMCAETFSTPEDIFFSPQKKIKCPNIFSPLPRFTFGSPFFLKSALKTYC